MTVFIIAACALGALTVLRPGVERYSSSSLGPSPERVTLITDPIEQTPRICQQYITSRQQLLDVPDGDTACLVKQMDQLSFGKLKDRLSRLLPIEATPSDLINYLDTHPLVPKDERLWTR
jgi:hypothetical protein